MISNRSFVKFSINNIPYYLSLSYIIICLFFALFAFFIIPDKSVNANKMNLNIQSMKPGFKVKTLSIPNKEYNTCLLYTSPSPRDSTRYRMPSYA